MTTITLPRATVEQALAALEKYRKMMFVEAGCRFGEGDAAIAALRAALAESGGWIDDLRTTVKAAGGEKR